MITIKKAFVRFGNANKPLVDLNDIALEWSGLATLAAPSGAGKTTLFRLLAGWFHQDDPRVTAIIDWNLRTPAEVKFIGLHSGLLPWLTVVRNISLLSRSQQHDFAHLLNEVGLDEAVLPLYPYQLSLGMYKRVELVAAILQKPVLLLLDEYFTSIDEDTKTLVKHFIVKRRKEGMTWIIAHEAGLRQWISTVNFILEVDPRTRTVHKVTKL